MVAGRGPHIPSSLRTPSSPSPPIAPSSPILPIAPSHQLNNCKIRAAAAKCRRFFDNFATAFGGHAAAKCR